jgi:hypothetical protein
MRDSVESFISNGGNAAFLSGNTSYWQIRLEDDGDTVVCYKDADLDPLAESDPSLTTVKWADPPVRASERKMTGVSGAYLYDTDVSPAIWQTYNVIDENHWVFEDTGLTNGDAFGFYIRAGGQIRSALGPETDTTGNGTPGSFHVLAEMYDGSTPHDDVTATMVISEGRGGRGTVSAATIDWALGLTAGGGTPMDQITRNVIGRLSER